MDYVWIFLWICSIATVGASKGECNFHIFIINKFPYILLFKHDLLNFKFQRRFHFKSMTNVLLTHFDVPLFSFIFRWQSCGDAIARSKDINKSTPSISNSSKQWHSIFSGRSHWLLLVKRRRRPSQVESQNQWTLYRGNPHFVIHTSYNLWYIQICRPHKKLRQQFNALEHCVELYIMFLLWIRITWY